MQIGKYFNYDNSKQHAIKTYEWLEVYLHAVFNSILNSDEWKLHVSVTFTSGKFPVVTH
jgi:hypothetical protein